MQVILIDGVSNDISKEWLYKRQPQVAESTALSEFIDLWMASNRMFILLESIKQIGFQQMDNGFPV